jgi:Holliday junction DNA helicase RuvA
MKAPGIGKKTAERLLLELRGKLGADIGNVAHTATSHHADILQALAGLGYSDKESAAAVKTVPADATVSEGIRLALKQLSR